MSTKPDNPPAFPLEKQRDVNGDYYYPAQHQGMTLRDYFAARAMPRSLAKMETMSEMAAVCYRAADAMLAERARKEEIPT